MSRADRPGNPRLVRRAWRRFCRDRLALIGLSVLVIVGLAGVFRSVISPHRPDEQLTGPPFSSPSWDHLLGTDDFGRDIFSRILEGAAVSMRFSLIVVFSALLIAVPIGLLSGYVGGLVDNVLMRIMDSIMAMPGLVLAIALVSVLGANLTSAAIAISAAMIPGFTRLVRGQTLAVRQETFIEASHVIGTSTPRILVRHIFPNILSPLIVQASIVLGVVLIAEASLNFLGLGAQPPTASWGLMLRNANAFLLTEPWQVFPPGLAIAVSVLAFNTVGDGLRAALGSTDPVRKYGRLGLTTVARPNRVASPNQTGGLPPGRPDLVVSGRPSDRSDGRSRPAAGIAARSNGHPPLLVVEDLQVDFETPIGATRIVDRVSFSVAPGETLGLVGESGSGKTVTSLAIMRLLRSPPVTITGGSVMFDGTNLLEMRFNEMARLRGDDLAMIFQDPMASLNPALTVERQIAQVVLWHEGASRKEARKRALEALEHVGVSAKRANSYPHEFSGGMRQRAMIAMALVCRPKLLIADEPTTALDVTIQAQVLELLRELRSELGMAMIFVTHDLGVVADICDRVAVMYAGEIVETAPVDAFFRNPRHPYAEGLLRAMPQKAEPRSELYTIPGTVPQFHELGDGCRLAGRCAYTAPQCHEQRIALLEVAQGQHSRCIRADELELGTK